MGKGIDFSHMAKKSTTSESAGIRHDICRNPVNNYVDRTHPIYFSPLTHCAEYEHGTDNVKSNTAVPIAAAVAAPTPAQTSAAAIMPGADGGDSQSIMSLIFWRRKTVTDFIA
jgi:hypothetical protein